MAREVPPVQERTGIVRNQSMRFLCFNGPGFPVLDAVNGREIPADQLMKLQPDGLPPVQADAIVIFNPFLAAVPSFTEMEAMLHLTYWLAQTAQTSKVVLATSFGHAYEDALTRLSVRLYTAKLDTSVCRIPVVRSIEQISDLRDEHAVLGRLFAMVAPYMRGKLPRKPIRLSCPVTFLAETTEDAERVIPRLAPGEPCWCVVGEGDNDFEYGPKWEPIRPEPRQVSMQEFYADVREPSGEDIRPEFPRAPSLPDFASLLREMVAQAGGVQELAQRAEHAYRTGDIRVLLDQGLIQQEGNTNVA